MKEDKTCSSSTSEVAFLVGGSEGNLSRLRTRSYRPGHCQCVLAVASETLFHQML
jgi:hypothetical protein